MTAPDVIPEELRVSSPAEITAYLQQLQRDGAAVQLSGPQGLNLAAQIITVDDAADIIGLMLGADPEGISQTLVADDEITAVAYLGAIKLQFELEGAVLISSDLGTVLRAPLPTRLYRFQRRQSFRVQPAGSTYPRVVLPGGHEPGRALRVLDLSIGGVALAQPADFPALVPGHIVRGLVLELDRISALDITLLPHHASPIRGEPGSMLQLGCSFVDLDATVARSLQVYVDQTQKRRRLLKLDP